MAQAIERARELLRALASDKAVRADVGTAIYQEWVAASSTGEHPFSRFLIESGKVPAETVRQTLRRLAVDGLPNPDVHTRERFEDLILCQLGVESGLISPKLVKTVRAVQEKKLKQGKLRRVRDLLPRAGFDTKTLGLLEQHMRERVLICPECLTRYPPAEDAYYSGADCPRCGAEVSPEGFDLEASAELQGMPEHLRVILNESAERLFEPMSAQQRERPRRRQSSNSTPQVLLGVCVVTLIVIGGFAYSLSSRSRPPTKNPPPNKAAGTDTPPPAVDPGDEPDSTGGSLGDHQLQGLIAKERGLTKAGDYAAALRMWGEQSLPEGAGGAELREEVALRVDRLKTLSTQADRVRALLERVQADPSDEAAERELARFGEPAETPPFDQAREQLLRLRAARRRTLSEVGRRRFDELEVADDTVDEDGAWSTLASRIKQGPVELSTELEGKLQRVRVTALDRQGATLTVRGKERRVAWSDSWLLGFDVVKAVARSSPAERQLVLRFALLARDANEAREVAQELGGRVDVGVLLEGAKLGAAPQVNSAGLRLDYSFGGRSWPADFTRSQETTLSMSREGSTLKGPQPSAQSPKFPVSGESRIAFGCQVEREDTVEVSARVSLFGEKNVAYELRWSAAGWRLLHDDGRGTPRSMEKGPQVVAARKIEIRVIPSGSRHEIVVSLSGAEVYRRPIYDTFDAAQFSCSTEAAEFRLDRVWVVGSIDPSWVTPLEREFEQEVGLALSRSEVQTTPSDTETTWPELSVEDPQGMATLDDEQSARLEEGKRLLRQGSLGAADAQLQGVEGSAARFYRAYREVLGGDPAGAIATLQRLLNDDPGFAGARSLLAYALARVGRADLATAEAAESLSARMDLPWAHLADARARWQSLSPDDPLDSETLLTAFENPAALDAGDPLVLEETDAVRELLRMERVLDQRVGEQTYTVLFNAPTSLVAAREVAQFLIELEKRFESVLRDDGFSQQRVWLLDPAATFEGLDAASAGHLQRFDTLVLRGSPTASSEVVAAAADAYIARNLPVAPAWLRVGLRAELQSKAPGLEDSTQVLKSRVRRERWSEERWRALFTQPAWEFPDDLTAQAHAWALVRAASKIPELQRALGQDLERFRSGEANTSDVANLNWAKLKAVLPNSID